MAFRLLTAYTPQGLPASYHCWLELPGQLQRLPASLEEVAGDSGLIHCQAQQVGRCPSPQSHLPLDTSCRLGLRQALRDSLTPFNPLSFMRPALGMPRLGDVPCTGWGWGGILWGGASRRRQAGVLGGSQLRRA